MFISLSRFCFNIQVTFYLSIESRITNRMPPNLRFHSVDHQQNQIPTETTRTTFASECLRQPEYRIRNLRIHNTFSPLSASSQTKGAHLVHVFHSSSVVAPSSPPHYRQNIAYWIGNGHSLTHIQDCSLSLIVSNGKQHAHDAFSGDFIGAAYQHPNPMILRSCSRRGKSRHSNDV